MAVCRWLSWQGPWRPRKRGRKKGAQEECVGPNPTDRAKSGVKKSVLVEGHGRPLAVAIGGANTPDAKLLKATLEAIVVERPTPTKETPQHLCLDKGYDNAPAEAIVTAAGYVPHITPLKPPTHRRGKTRRSAAKNAPGSPLGGRAHLCLALAVPWYPRALREAGRAVFSNGQTGLWPALVPLLVRVRPNTCVLK